jgi:predicted short-subunit dehydrogenase-like oxidoreductase (DUF2520 family)
MSMVTLYSRLGAGPGVEVVHGYRVLYGIALACFSIFLLCVLAASLSVWMALAFAALAALLLGVAGCVLPKRRGSVVRLHIPCLSCVNRASAFPLLSPV